MRTFHLTGAGRYMLRLRLLLPEATTIRSSWSLLISKELVGRARRFRRCWRPRTKGPRQVAWAARPHCILVLNSSRCGTDLFAGGRWSELDPLITEVWPSRRRLDPRTRAQLAAIAGWNLYW